MAEKLTGGEREAFLAGRFAAREAFLKAAGVGFDGTFEPKDIAVLRLPSGAPVIELRGAARDAAREMGIVDCQVSISHAGGIAVAVVILLTSQECGGGARSVQPTGAFRQADSGDGCFFGNR